MVTTMTRFTPLAFAALLVTAASACEGNHLTDPNAPGVLALSLSAQQAPADGSTVVQVTATVDPDTRGDARKLTFTTGGGVFTDNGKNEVTAAADENGVVRVGLQAPGTAGLVRVRVSVGAAQRVDSVTFTRAFPEQLLVDAEKFAVSQGVEHEIKVTAQLRRAVGIVTTGAAVTFHALRTDTQEEIGQFGVSTLSDAAGQVTLRYTPGATPYRGRIRIVATTSGAAGQISGETSVEVID